MLFLEVKNAEEFWENSPDLDLSANYENVRLKPIQKLGWGKNALFANRPAFCGTSASSMLE